MAGTIQANGIEMAYRFDGPEDGAVVMLSNSLATNYGMWDPQIPALADKYRVLRYDQRGHGGTEATAPPYSFDLLMEDACALLEALNISKAHFCGLSMGGMTGQTFGAKRPDMLLSLILCDTASAMPSADLWTPRIEMARNEGMPALAPSTLERWFTEPYRKAQTTEVARVADMISTTKVDGFVGCASAILAMNLAPLHANITAPTLVVVGADDPSTTVERAEEIHHGIAGSKLVVLDDAAHLSNIEQADGFNAALRAHLDQN